MGAEVFHGRVRDGIGCVILAMTTGPPGRTWTGIGCDERIWVCVGCGDVHPVSWLWQCGDARLGAARGGVRPFGQTLAGAVLV